MYNQIALNKRRTAILIGIFIAAIIGIGYLIGLIAGGNSSAYISFALIFSLFSALIGYYQGDKMALWATGAVAIQKEQNPYVYRIVENLCITAGLPMPKIYLIPDPAPNAFATGRDPKRASIAFTTGIVEMLENEELEAVTAHELSHIKNYDIRLMTVVAILVGTIALLADWSLRASFFGRGRDRERSDGQLGAIIAVLGIILIILSPIIAQLIQLAVSRRREFLADASGALLTRYPAGLASALRKISSYKQPMMRASGATAHLFIANPFGGDSKKFLAKLFSTHPPIEERIKALNEMII